MILTIGGRMKIHACAQIRGRARSQSRVEVIEQRIEERNAILPTAKRGLTLDEIRDRIDHLEKGDE